MKRTLTRLLILVVLLAGTVFALPDRKTNSCTQEDCCTECVLARLECKHACGDEACTQACWGAYFLCRSQCGACP